MAALITLARAKENIGGTLGSANPSLNADEDTTLENIIDSLSKLTRAYCRTEFEATTYDEIYHVDPIGIFQLNHYPVISVTSCRGTPVPAIQIQNTNTATNQYAYAEIQSTLLRLSRTASAVTTNNDTSVYATFPTITDLVANINAVGTSWTALTLNNLGNMPSADLYIAQYPNRKLNARDVPAYAPLFTQTIDHGYNPETGTFFTTGSLACNFTPYYFPRTFEDTGPVPLRIKYSAGWSSIPDDLSQAIADWTAAIFYQTKRDPSAGTVATATTSTNVESLWGNCPRSAKVVIDMYKQRRS